jgi:bifunctional polynucleotide phosphatase/kinase
MLIDLKDVIVYESKDFQEQKGNVNIKIALFDLDNTLITPKNGRNPATLHLDTDPKNYVYLEEHDKLSQKFNMLKKAGYVIAIVTNQSKYRQQFGALELKLRYILKDFKKYLGWKPYMFINIGSDYLKPAVLSFNLLLALNGLEIKDLKINKNKNILKIEKVNLPQCFMVGDAVGKEDPYLPYRYANFDKMYAKNISQEFRNTHKNLGKPKKGFSENSPDFCKFIRASDFFPHHKVLPRAHRELVIMVGQPGSGKSTTSALLQKAGYDVCVSDFLKSNKELLIECVKMSLESKNRVIVDALNFSKEQRSRYTKLARAMKVPIRILWHPRWGYPFNAARGKEEAMILGTTYKHKEPVPDVAFYNYTKNFEEPTESEGQIEIVF